MKSTDAPSKQAVPFGTNGPREAITPTTPSGSNQASYDQGFPPITMTLKSAGGLPPKGQDMNQILFEQSSFNRYFAAGGGYVYDSTFSTAVGGYPLSARIPNSTGTGFWFNTVEDNQTNPENNTAALTGWIPMGSYGVTSLTGLTSSSITLTALQASKDRITLAGTLTANINIVVPAWLKRWEVVNNCTGPFSVTIKTPSGTGVSVPTGNNSLVLGDGTNITLSLSPGSLIGIRVIKTTGTYIPTTGTKNIVFELCGGGGGGGGSAATGAGQSSVSCGGWSGDYIRTQPLVAAPSYTITIGTAGVGGAAGVNAGTNGGSTIVSSIIFARGGVGASGGPSVSTGFVGGGFGSFSGTLTYPSGSVVVPSSGGQRGTICSAGATSGAVGGSGGFSLLGAAGYGTTVGGRGQDADASGYGAGGAGGMQTSSAGAVAGGNGTPGVVIAWEYA